MGCSESAPDANGHITLDAKQAGKRSAGNPHAAFDEAGGWKRDQWGRIHWTLQAARQSSTLPWEAKPDESDDGSGMVVLRVTACGNGDCSDTDVAIGDTFTLDYDTDDAGEIQIEVVPGTPATRTVLPPSATAQIPSVEVLFGESVTVTLSEYFHGATSYNAVSAAIDQLGVSVARDVLTLDPLAVTGTPVVVTVTGANEGGEETITFSVSVVAAESEQTDAEKLIGTWEWTDGDVRHILTFTKTRWIDYRVGDDDADSGDLAGIRQHYHAGHNRRDRRQGVRVRHGRTYDGALGLRRTGRSYQLHADHGPGAHPATRSVDRTYRDILVLIPVRRWRSVLVQGRQR